VRVLCVSVGGEGSSDGWLTLGHEYDVLSILILSKGTGKFRILADDGRTPFLADVAGFSAASQDLPDSWVAVVREGGAVEIGPRPWLELGFWERYFDGDPVSISEFEEELRRMTSG
jgi:hypothetical protein